MTYVIIRDLTICNGRRENVEVAPPGGLCGEPLTRVDGCKFWVWAVVLDVFAIIVLFTGLFAFMGVTEKQTWMVSGGRLADSVALEEPVQGGQPFRGRTLVMWSFTLDSRCLYQRHWWIKSVMILSIEFWIIFNGWNEKGNTDSCNSNDPPDSQASKCKKATRSHKEHFRAIKVLLVSDVRRATESQRGCWLGGTSWSGAC